MRDCLLRALSSPGESSTAFIMSAPRLPSAPPPTRTFVAAQRIAHAPPAPSVPRPSAHAVQRLAEMAVTNGTSTSSAARADVCPPSRPPPSRTFVKQQQEAAASATNSPEPPSAMLQRYAVHVGDSIPTASLEAVSASLIAEARRKFHARRFEEALQGFAYGLAVYEQLASRRPPSSSYATVADDTEHGALMHNIASCLHCLGDFEAAKAHYERALEAFSSARPPSRLSYLVYGNIDHKRCEFVRERLADVALGRLPDLDKYLDSFGHRRAVTEYDREAQPREAPGAAPGVPPVAPPARLASYAAASPSMPLTSG